MTESPARNSAESSVDLAEAPIRVLSVDDEAGFLKITKQILEVHFAFQVDTASSIDEAMDKMKKTTYDVIVSDYQMPGKDGLQFLKELRDGENDVPFILFTGKGREEIAIESLNLGADGYFNKMGDSETVYGELVHGIRQAVEKKKAEQEVAKARNEYLSITNLTGDIIVNVDRKDRWTFLNDGACMFWGKPREELLGKTFRDYLHPEDYEKTAASAIQENIETRQIVRGVVNRQKTPKGWRTVEWNAAPLFDKSGEYVGMQATGRDITERKRAEEAIEHLARFPSENPNPVIRIAKDGVIIYANTAAKSLLSEWKREVGQSVPDFWRQKVATSFASGSSMRFEIERLDRVVSFEVSPVTDAGYVNAYGRDITERKKAEDLLQRSEKRWVDSFNSLEDVMLIINTDYIIEKINDIGLKLFGKTREEVIGKKCFQILHNLDSSIEQCPFKRTLKTGKAESVDLYDKTFDKYFNFSCSPIFNEQDEIVRHVDLIKDITTRKKSENVLEESEERYRSLFESAREGIVFAGPEGKLTKMNDAFVTMLGYDNPEELVGMPAAELNLDPKTRNRKLFKDILEKGCVTRYELTLKKKDGSPIYVLCSGLTRSDENGNILQTEAFITDITERKRMEGEVEAERRKLTLAIDTATDIMGLADLDGNLIYINKAFERVTGYKSEEILGKKLIHLQSKDQAALALTKFREIIEKGFVRDFELEFISKDNQRINTLASGALLSNSEGKPNEIFLVAKDVTERKKTEIALEESEERYRSLFESAREGITITDSEGKILRMNDAFAVMLGYDSAEELVGFSAVELYHDREARRILFEEIGERGYVEGYELTLKKRDGSPISVLGSSLTRKDEEGNITQTEGFFMDITERKKVENALEESEERYRRLFESVREGMIITGPEGKLLRVNRAAATMLGYDSPEELVGIPAVELYLDPKDREAMFKETMRRGYVDHYEVIFKKRDGSPIYILGSNVTRKDEEGKILQIEAFFMDITERKTREEEMKRRLMRFRLDDGNLYLVKESSPALSLEAFKDLLNVGYHGLVFSRTPEEEFKKNVDGSFEFWWLAERGGEKSLSTFEKIENNLEKSIKKSVILLDGLDYLILKNGFKEALFFVQHLREFTHLTDNVVILSVDPSTLNAHEVRLLEKEGREVEPQIFVRLPEDLMEILRFIYEHNALGSKPNYTDIRQELSISKPTVGKRIKILINTGYVTENPRGRSKVLELTYKGMRLFLK